MKPDRAAPPESWASMLRLLVDRRDDECGQGAALLVSELVRCGDYIAGVWRVPAPID